ncbi:MAG: alpha/beta hydrolase [Dehalococcoidia bacterium]|nr:alpha/beta hydrolase [Dehalococcoidia bacterium]
MNLVEHQLDINGMKAVCFEQAGQDPSVVFAHATGFHARCWDEVIENLANQQCYAPDLRGHGRSEKTPPPYPWPVFAEDILGLCESFDIKGAIGVGHSMGGFAVTLAAALNPKIFSALLLIDPVILPPEAYVETGSTNQHFVARRRNEWSSVSEMFERFSTRPPFNSWREEALQLYCEYGLLPNSEGTGFVLACPPAIEAAVYDGAKAKDPYPLLGDVHIPVRILRSSFTSSKKPDEDDKTPNMSASPTVKSLAGSFQNASDILLYERSHFIPMEDPVLVAEQVKDLITVVTS